MKQEGTEEKDREKGRERKGIGQEEEVGRELRRAIKVSSL